MSNAKAACDHAFISKIGLWSNWVWWEQELGRTFEFWISWLRMRQWVNVPKISRSVGESLFHMISEIGVSRAQSSALSREHPNMDWRIMPSTSRYGKVSFGNSLNCTWTRRCNLAVVEFTLSDLTSLSLPILPHYELSSILASPKFIRVSAVHIQICDLQQKLSILR